MKQKLIVLLSLVFIFAINGNFVNAKENTDNQVQITETKNNKKETSYTYLKTEYTQKEQQSRFQELNEYAAKETQTITITFLAVAFVIIIGGVIAISKR